ncbi:polyamine ABC transporter permease [Komagataeibacter nataicola]|uniref:Polyamine ABC transporter permease n=2 Tax=Komagataeibacter nataicola TaxID=265960 RepID=A0A9N7CMQ3_9PROT|nr:ABC transporter permease [Komagataeibacter nataicola]AQU88403.1 polyamine ABC transporter permease [Komagataeibacter nataicola]PYD65207.1 polyamine ABC transporter permease [Komagataeibacter nataicola]WEQ54501.1 ABC transporter permease [Komagataeibacter nataicola]GBR21475.1 spermidine/putrescine ABC transporter permease [Komagataeibacter nataicola NRIC 0616]
MTTRLMHRMLLLPGLVALVVTFCLPVAWLLHMSFMPEPDSPPGHAAISFHAYAQVLEDGFYWWVVWQTVRIGLVVTCLTVPLSFPIALFLSRSTSPWRGTLAALAVAPLLTSTVIRTYGWMVILGRHGLINRTLLGLGVLSMPVRLDNGTFATIVALVEILMPYAIISILGGMGRLTVELEQAAALLGAPLWKVFMRITVPLALPGLLTASLLVFVLSISSLVTPQLMGGGRVFVLSTEIFSQTTQALNWPLAGALSTLLLALFGSVIVLYQRAARRLEDPA